MKLNPIEHVGYKVYDCLDHIIGYVQEYDTETRVITLLIPNASESRIVFGLDGPKKVTFVLEGSYVIDAHGNRL